MITPNSALTIQRPDIWQRGLALASGLTGYAYLPKIPLHDGTIFACGGGWGSSVPYVPPPPPSPEKVKQDKIYDIDLNIKRKERQIEDIGQRIGDMEKQRSDLEIEIEDLKKEKATLLAAPSVFVPDGAMEWLLHEVGHWVAATPEERTLPDYGIPVDLAYDDKSQIKTSGFGYEREWQAWAFEEIILAPFGPSRLFCPPSHRGGVGYSKTYIPPAALSHIQNQMHAERIDVEAWRVVMGDWIAWGVTRGQNAPWLAGACAAAIDFDSIAQRAISDEFQEVI